MIYLGKVRGGKVRGARAACQYAGTRLTPIQDAPVGAGGFTGRKAGLQGPN